MGLSGAVGADPFVHQALIYGSEDEFVAAALPFVREAIAAGEPTLVAVKPGNVGALREALGPDAQRIGLKTVDEWYETATRTRMRFATWVEERMRAAARVRLIGEPPWPLDSEARVRDWARHEAVINVAFEGVPLTFACPYDTRELPPEVIRHAGCTHPEILTAAGVSASDSYADPRDFCAGLNGSGIGTIAADPVAELVFARGTLPVLRRLVEREARAAGVSADRVHDLVVATNEIATNSVLHGREPRRIRIWRMPDELVLAVSDAGAGPGDPLAGQLKPDLEQPGGWGVWIARMMSDALEIAADESGTTVVLRAVLPSDREPAAFVH